MARLESVALGGYYATPTHLTPRIASLISCPTLGRVDGEDGYSYESRNAAFVDPCAADGEALFTLAKAITGQDEGDYMRLYACELEVTRHAKLMEHCTGRWWRSTVLHGDAFRVTFQTEHHDGAHVLYLNPPYDTDRVHGRLEHKFLDRVAPCLTEGGILVFVVPYYALEASAELLARDFTDLRCFRFPGEDFASYKQVVLYGVRRQAALGATDPGVRDLVLGWARDADSIPELPENGPALYSLTPSREHVTGLSEWSMRPVDLKALYSKVRPWYHTPRVKAPLAPVPNILPQIPIAELLLRKYPMAMPPRPAHIAAGIAAGLFNGSRIDPNDPSSKLPPLLVKGVFDREFKAIEEKHAKDGAVKGVVEVQQPRLRTTVLDLSTHKYHALRSGTDTTKGELSVASMTVADLLEHYGNSMMGVMESQCPVLYDPRKDEDAVPLAPSPRRLFRAQAHAARAIVRMLGGPEASKAARRGKTAILLGEIGSGKSTVALVSAVTVGARRVLVMCPPHLLEGWTNEVRAVLPDAEVRVLANVADVDAVANLPADDDRVVISIMSREAAKLTHGWESVQGTCPACGQVQPSDIDFAKRRYRCTHQSLLPTDKYGAYAIKLAYKLMPYSIGNPTVLTLLSGRFDKRRLSHYSGGKRPAYEVPRTLLLEALDAALSEDRDGIRTKQGLIAHLLAALGDEQVIVDTILKVGSLLEDYDYYVAELARHLLLMLPPGGEKQEEVLAGLKAIQARVSGGWDLSYETSVVRRPDGGVKVGEATISWSDGTLRVDKMSVGSPQAAGNAVHALAKAGHFKRGRVCGEPLFQAIPEPRRTALAKYIAKRHSSLFDLFVADECHEYATSGSAQERSAHRLTALGLPTILMTGTIMNGYAKSLFTNMWSSSAAFRDEFNRDEQSRFVERYGYLKRYVEYRDSDGEVVEYGSNSDRVTRSEKTVGDAPGVLPLFLLRHLLPISATLHKTDLAIDLPPCNHYLENIQPDPELKRRYNQLVEALVEQIRADRWEEGLSGKLWGQLAEIPSYLDRATEDVGNCENGSYEIRYPESVGRGLVASMDPLPASTILPKEEYMLRKVEEELAEGRNVMVFSWHVALLPRLARLISERTGEKVPILYADKVPTGKRQDWINREVLKKGRRVLVVNPVAIQTGLNNLVHFSTEIWMENPACNPVTFRQAIGRVDRIGQKKETRIYVPIYEDTLQQQLYDLLMKKVAVSISTDGLDPESALTAAGLGEDDYLAGLSIGKQLWAMMTDGTREAA